MANKTKRRSVSTSSAGQSVAASTRSTATHTFSNEFKPDYTYVKQDLKRIAYLAVAFVVILVVLSFFLR
jgi:hypothetical protein